jgi:hypothetical protein
MHFRSRLAVAFVMILRCIACCGQTNDCSSPSIQFCLPSVHLRGESRPGIFQLEKAVAGNASSVSVGSIQSEKTVNGWDFHSRVFQSDQFYLTRSTSTAPSDSGLVRFVDRIFTPEVVQVGKVSVTSPILTVAKTKNPLCLLSALATDRGLLTFNLLELSW